MTEKEKSSLDCPPNLRLKTDDETTPDYLNYIFDTVDKFHTTLLIDQSPFYKIATIFDTKKPLGLDDIQNIINEVKNLDRR